MQKIIHKIDHQYQPTNNSCGYASLAILLSHYDRKLNAEDLIKLVPQPKSAEGETFGSVTAQLVEWCQSNGFQTCMYASDMYILDLSWKVKTSNEIKDRLISICDKRKVPIFDAHWTKIYIDAYVAMLEEGAELKVLPFITSELLYKLVKDGPIFTNICSTASSGNGRSKSVGLRKSDYDDVDGNVVTHSVVIYGHDKDGNFLVADPWDGLTTHSPEHMVLSIEAAQIECDNQIFVIKK